jgi:hypothetical protein
VLVHDGEGLLRNDPGTTVPTGKQPELFAPAVLENAEIVLPIQGGADTEQR